MSPRCRLCHRFCSANSDLSSAPLPEMLNLFLAYFLARKSPLGVCVCVFSCLWCAWCERCEESKCQLIPRPPRVLGSLRVNFFAADFGLQISEAPPLTLLGAYCFFFFFFSLFANSTVQCAALFHFKRFKCLFFFTSGSQCDAVDSWRTWSGC